MTTPAAAARVVTGLAVVLTVLAALVSTGACAAVNGDPPMKTYADLQARPRLEDITARYEQMQLRIRDALDAEFGPLGWYQVRDATPSNCGHDVPAQFGGRTLHLAPWGFDAPIPDQRWPRTTQVVAAITGEYGFATAGLEIDEPRYHLINGVDPALGATYRFGSKKNTTMQVTTGCHLPTATPTP